MCFIIHDCRLHTLAYVKSSEKLYAFGSGEYGQLGNNKVVTVNSPVVVENSWVANDRKSHCRVQRIATGGDHCYVVTLKNVSNKTCNFNSVTNDYLPQVKCLIYFHVFVSDVWNVDVAVQSFMCMQLMSEIHSCLVEFLCSQPKEAFTLDLLPFDLH